MKIVPGLELEDGLSEPDKKLLEIENKAKRYLSLSESKSKVDKEMKKLKQEIYKDFNDIPEQYKTESVPHTVVVAGQTFVKKIKNINFETVSIQMRQRINTTLSREGLYKLIEDKRKEATTDSEIEILDDIKDRIDRMLNPNLSDVVEPQKRIKRTKRKYKTF